MRNPLFITSSIALLGTASCTHITMLGHKTGYDVNAEFSGDPISPVSLNAGFEGRTFAAVPPREALQWKGNFDPTKLPKKDVMSSLLELKIQKVHTAGQGDNVPFDYVTSGATGLAADAASGADPTAPFIQNTSDSKSKTQAKEISDKIKAVTDSQDKAFGS